MTIPLVFDGVFTSEEALREMIAARRVCFDHDRLSVKDGANRLVQIGFELNLYAAFEDPRHLPTGDDPELGQLIGDLRRLCRVFFQSLNVLEPCRHPEPPMQRVVYAPERRYGAEVCLQVPIVHRDQESPGLDRRLEGLLATAECLLRQLGARRGTWEDRERETSRSMTTCEDDLKAASGSERREA